MTIHQLREDLLSGEKGICFFVHEGAVYWVCDVRYNFTLDAEKDYRGYLEKGHINQAQFDAACLEFRGGILHLTADNFLSYIALPEVTVLSLDQMDALFGSREAQLLSRIERHYLDGVPLAQGDFSAANALASRLPSFYINFDRCMYMHMDYGRAHEDLAYSTWVAKAADFSYLIPDVLRYWCADGDYWKMKYV